MLLMADTTIVPVDYDRSFKYFYIMKKVSILALNDATMSSIDSAYQILTRVNDFLRYRGKAGFYEVEIVGFRTAVELNYGLYRIRIDRTIDSIKKTDIIIIPLTCGDFPTSIRSNAPFSDWVKEQHWKGAEVVSLCVGSFFLASTGLLNGRKCAIHWAAKNEFNALFPLVKATDTAIITDENNIYTCGGGFSYLNLLLYIIEKHVGRDVSIIASKMFEIDIDRKSQQPFIIFIGQKRHGDQTVLDAQEMIENNPTLNFTVEYFCGKLNISRRTLERRFKKCTGNSIVEYIQRVKVEFTKKQLEANQKSVSEIISETGYTNADSFRRIFKRYTELSPIEYRKKYNS
jgi:transcriptional regulator GlxA family with amidase domain